jgi:hypothetical protein
MRLCRTHVHCKQLQGSWLRFQALDLAHVRVDGVLVGSVWRAIPPSIRLQATGCSRPGDMVELSITTFAYGRDNFFAKGTHTALSKGIIGDVVLAQPGHTARVLTGWKVAAMPLLEPGRVLRWGGRDAETSTRALVRSGERLPFDSLHGGVWRKDVLEAREGAAPAGSPGAWQRKLSGHGPTFYRCVGRCVDWADCGCRQDCRSHSNERIGVCHAPMQPRAAQSVARVQGLLHGQWNI